MKVSILCFMAVMLATLSTGDSWDADLKDLTKVVNILTINYDPTKKDPSKHQYSFAANIPEADVKDDLTTFLTTDKPEVVLKAVEGATGVHVGVNLVEARPKIKNKPKVHAEVRVLDNMGGFTGKEKDHRLAFYTYFSPCSRCTGGEAGKNILEKFVERGITKWTQRAFVFTKVYDKKPDGVPVPEDVISEALSQLGNSVFGHDNIFHCYGPTGAVQCIKCFDNNKKPVKECLEN